MTVNLYGVNDALENEGKAVERIRRALNWKLRKKERGEKEIEEATETSEESLPAEAH